jgi:hypothetical protein
MNTTASEAASAATVSEAGVTGWDFAATDRLSSDRYGQVGLDCCDNIAHLEFYRAGSLEFLYET